MIVGGVGVAVHWSQVVSNIVTVVVLSIVEPAT